MPRLGPRTLLLFICFLAVPAVAADWKPPVEPKALEKEIKETIREYDALSGNHDLIQTRRRRELIRRLGLMPHKKTVKALRTIVQRESDIRARINAMYSLVQVGDIKAVNAMYKYVLKQARTVLPAYLGRALSRTNDDEVKAWIVQKPLQHGNRRIKLSAIEALGNLRYKPATAQLLAIYNKEANKQGNAGNAVVMYETARALGRIGGKEARPILHKLAKSKDWRMRLAAAEVMLDHFKDPESIALMRELSKAERQVIREEAAVTVGRNKVEPLFDALILTLREGNLRCKWAAYEAMKAISGQDLQLAPDAWDKWWRDKKKGKLNKDGAIAKGERMSVSTYYNFKIFSDRVLFVIDT
ncbi:MAG: HEAT repeat domain-containing protein, partial [Planctomycetota bacterium]